MHVSHIILIKGINGIKQLEMKEITFGQIDIPQLYCSNFFVLIFSVILPFIMKCLFFFLLENISFIAIKKCLFYCNYYEVSIRP